MRNILFVDDEQMVLDGLRRMLRPMRKEWNMRFVDSGRKALQLMEKERFDVIVSDMRMPEMDGVTLLNEVRSRHPDVIRLALSGHSDSEMLLESVKATHQFLSKPCDAAMLKDTVNRALGLRALLKREDIGRVIARIESLPSLPTLYQEVMAQVSSANGSLAKVGEIISRDLGMTAKILQLVNSSFFGLSTHVSSPAQATSLLGLDTIRGLILTSKVFSQFDTAHSRLDLEALWVHSTRVGALSREIAREAALDRREQDHAFMAGMLHDLGKLVFACSFTEEYNRVLDENSGQEGALWRLEQEAFGCTHAEIGAYLMGIWGLPSTIVEALAYHHYPSHSSGAGFTPLAAVYVANVLLTYPAEDGEALRGKMDLPYLERLGCEARLPRWVEARDRLLGGEGEAA